MNEVEAIQFAIGSLNALAALMSGVMILLSEENRAMWTGFCAVNVVFMLINFYQVLP